jgi:hypothetical protein
MQRLLLFDDSGGFSQHQYLLAIKIKTLRLDSTLTIR